MHLMISMIYHHLLKMDSFVFASLWSASYISTYLNIIYQRDMSTLHKSMFMTSIPISQESNFSRPRPQWEPFRCLRCGDRAWPKKRLGVGQPLPTRMVLEPNHKWSYIHIYIYKTPKNGLYNKWVTELGPQNLGPHFFRANDSVLSPKCQSV